MESSELVKSASEKVVEAAQSGAKLIEQAPILSGLSENHFMWLLWFLPSLLETIAFSFCIKDFNKEQEEFIKTNKKTGPIKPPWVGFKDEEQLKEQGKQLNTKKLIKLTNHISP